MAINPVDNYLASRPTAAAEGALPAPLPGVPVPQKSKLDEENDFIARWQQAHQNDEFDHELTHQAFERYAPVLRGAVNKYKSPKTGPVIETEAKNRLIESLKSYDPTRGAAFTTHLTNNMRRLQRVNAQAQQAYTAEDAATYMGPAQQARDEFFDEHGREPTPEEHEQWVNEMLPAHRRLAPGKLQDILSRQRNVVQQSRFEGTPDAFQTEHMLDLHQQNLDTVRDALKPKTQLVHDAIRSGVTSTTALAEQLGMSPAAVSRAKQEIIDAVGEGPKKPKGF